MAQAFRFHILIPNFPGETYAVFDTTDQTFIYLEQLRRNPFRTVRGTQVFQLTTRDLRVFRYHFILPLDTPLASLPPSILIPGFIPLLIGTPSDLISEGQEVYTLIQFPPEVFHLDLLPAGAA